MLSTSDKVFIGGAALAAWLLWRNRTSIVESVEDTRQSMIEYLEGFFKGENAVMRDVFGGTGIIAEYKDILDEWILNNVGRIQEMLAQQAALNDNDPRKYEGFVGRMSGDPLVEAPGVPDLFNIWDPRTWIYYGI